MIGGKKKKKRRYKYKHEEGKVYFQRTDDGFVARCIAKNTKEEKFEQITVHIWPGETKENLFRFQISTGTCKRAAMNPWANKDIGGKTVKLEFMIMIGTTFDKVWRAVAKRYKKHHGTRYNTKIDLNTFDIAETF